MGLQENFQNELVSELELREPVTVHRGDDLRKVVTAMRGRKLGCAIVVDDDRKPIGIFTESMLTEMLTHATADMDSPIEKSMAVRCPWVRITDPISDVLEAMQMKNIRMLCVVDQSDHVVGLTGQRGVMEYIAEHFPGQVTVQRVGQPPSLTEREGA